MVRCILGVLNRVFFFSAIQIALKMELIFNEFGLLNFAYF